MTAPGDFPAPREGAESAIDAARDLMLAGEMVRETAIRADRQVAALEARWAAHRAAARAIRPG